MSIWPPAGAGGTVVVLRPFVPQGGAPLDDGPLRPAIPSWLHSRSSGSDGSCRHPGAEPLDTAVLELPARVVGVTVRFLGRQPGSLDHREPGSFLACFVPRLTTNPSVIPRLTYNLMVLGLLPLRLTKNQVAARTRGGAPDGVLLGVLGWNPPT